MDKPEKIFTKLENITFPDHLKSRVTSELLDEDTIYICSEEGAPQTCEFLCPCGCGWKAEVNLRKSMKPCWDLSIQDEKVTIIPSIWRKGNCDSHFFLKDNKIQWC